MKVRISWDSVSDDCDHAGCSGGFTTVLRVSSDQGHDLVYYEHEHLEVTRYTGHYSEGPGPDLYNPDEVLSRVLTDLGIEVENVK